MILRSKDSATAQVWFSAIHSNISDLLPRVIAEVREQLGKAGIAGSRELRHLGWLAEKVRGNVPSVPVIFPSVFQHLLQPLKSGTSCLSLILSFGFLVCVQQVCLCITQALCLQPL